MNEIEKMYARLNAISKELEEYGTTENFNKEDLVKIDSLSDEFETLKNNIGAAEKIAAIKENTVISNRKTVTPVASTSAVVVGNDLSKKKGGFENAGEFFKSIKNAASGTVDKRLKNTAVSTTGEDGGFLIPEDFRSEIQQKVVGDESLLSRTTQFKSSSNALVLPKDETAPWDGDGIQAYWEGENRNLRDSKASFGLTQMRLHKLTALVKVTDELLEDAPALQSYISMKAPAAMMSKINTALISGDGSGMPQGILNSGFAYKVAKEAAQTADTICYENIVKMEARLLPSSFAKSVWLINPQVKEQLRLMAFDKDATSKVPVYLPASGLDAAPYGTLMGRPVIPMMGGMEKLGDVGDIILADLSYIYSCTKIGGIKQSISTHVYFDQDLMAFKFTFRVAAACPFEKPVKTEKGEFEMSGFVTLAER